MLTKRLPSSFDFRMATAIITTIVSSYENMSKGYAMSPNTATPSGKPRTPLSKIVQYAKINSITEF